MNKTLEIFNNINTFLDEALERIDTIEHKVKHGKYKIQKKSVKDQVLDGHEPRDVKREQICKNARKKAHTSIADTRKDISDKARENTTSCHEGLSIVNESATTISEMYGLDFMEEAVGWDVEWTFFDKPELTPMSESLDIGTTKTGRKRKCKALGIAEGVFAPISSADGERVFSRNKRLYDSDHWDYQMENMNFVSRVNSRRMLGMIGHEDKKISDQDLRDGKVSHVVTDLEIREDEKNGKYLWGRLEILNTEAGRNLKEYYEKDIPLFVSSRAGGKLIDVPGQQFKRVDKQKYYCECFDVVREPGFLGAAPVYHPVFEDNEINSNAIDEIVESLNIEKAKLLEVIENVENRINEDNEMSKVNAVNIDTKSSAEDIIAQLLKPISEKISQIGDRLNSLEVVENVQESEAPAEEVKVEETSEAAAEEEKSSEVSEAKEDEKKCDCGKEGCPECGKKEDAKEEKKEACSEAAEEGEKVTDADAAKADLEKKDAKKAEDAKDEKKEEKVSESAEDGEGEAAPAEEKVEETSEAWAEKDPKETVTTIAGLPKPPLGGAAPTDIGAGAWANEDPKETAPEKSDIAGGEDAKKDALETKVEAEIHAEEAKDAAAVNAGVEGGLGVTAHESVEEKDEKKEEKAEDKEEKKEEVSESTEEAPAQDASELTQQITDYKALYESLKDEFDKCNQVIDDLLESIDSFGKRHQQVVQESLTSKEELNSVKEQLEVANKALNSYKLQEQFNVTVEKANELLSSKNYETVVEELKAAEAQQIEDEAQATADAVSESLSEAIAQPAPVSKRKAHSAFSATISESKDEEISESVETPKRRRAYSAF